MSAVYDSDRTVVMSESRQIRYRCHQACCTIDVGENDYLRPGCYLFSKSIDNLPWRFGRRRQRDLTDQNMLRFRHMFPHTLYGGVFLVTH